MTTSPFLSDQEVQPLFDAAFRANADPPARLEEFILFMERIGFRQRTLMRNIIASRGTPDRETARDCHIAERLHGLLFLLADRQRALNLVLRQSEPEFMKVLAKKLDADKGELLDAIRKTINHGGGGY